MRTTGPIRGIKARRPSADATTVARGPGKRMQGSRGATLVEYALIVSLIVIPSIGAISHLDDASGDYYTNASDDIGDLPQSGIDTGTNSSTPSGSTTTTTLPPTTTSTSTTLPPTTTTTAAPTTTTTAPTTTTTALRSTINQLTDVSTNSGSSYNAIARVKIVRNSTGTAVSSAGVTIRMVDRLGSSTTRTCNTDSTGRCTVTWSRSDSRSPVTATVTAVTASPTWDGSVQSVLLYAP